MHAFDQRVGGGDQPRSLARLEHRAVVARTRDHSAPGRPGPRAAPESKGGEEGIDELELPRGASAGWARAQAAGERAGPSARAAQRADRFGASSICAGDVSRAAESGSMGTVIVKVEPLSASLRTATSPP